MIELVYSQLKNLLVPSAIMYADIQGLRFDDSHAYTITITPLRPDLVIVSDACVQVLELTVQNNTPNNLKQARQRKQNKSEYLSLLLKI